MNRLTTCLALALTAASMIRAPAAARAAAQAGESRSTDSRVTIPVEGMTCAACSLSIRKALKKLDGVKAIEASHDKGQAVITYDPAKVSPERMVQAINDLGYKAGAPVKG